MVDIKNIMVIISSIIVRFFLLMLSVGYFAVYSPNFLKIPFDNFLESIHFTYLSKFELVILFLIISILLEFFSNTNLNLKNHIIHPIIQNPIIRKFFVYYYLPLSLFLFILGFFVAFIATLLKNSFFMQLGIQLSSLGILGLLGLILWVIIVYRPETRLIPFFVHHPYMRHVYVLMIFVASSFLVYRLGIDDLKVSNDTAFTTGIALFGVLTAAYMGYMGLVRKIADLEITEEVVPFLLLLTDNTGEGHIEAHRIKVINKGKIAAENVYGIIEDLNYKKRESRTSWHEGEKDVPYTTINAGDHMFLNIYGIRMRRINNSPLVGKTDDITMATENGWNWHNLIDTSLDLKFAIRVTAKNASPKRKVFKISRKNNLELVFLNKD
jgi:hypothetical protein